MSGNRQMTVKCSKCIERFREERRRLELIQDLKAKNESVSHASLKHEVYNMIRELWKGKGYPISVETEFSVEGIGKVDVVARIGGATIAVECGRTTPKKILALKKLFDVVLHIPYCYTWDFVEINFEKFKHEVFVASIGKRLEKSKIEFERNKVFCLEEGECSLPSRRDGYPEEAMKMAGLLP